MSGSSDSLQSNTSEGPSGSLRGKRYWRSLEELADTPEFQRMLQDEFPAGASQWSDGLGRRSFLKFMAASAALAGVTGCVEKPQEDIVPYVRKPELVIPGKPLYFATSMTFGGCAIGLLVESHMGRPTKVEGNPLHPASLGASGIFEQASLLTFYDPDRSQTVKNGRHIATWDAFLTNVTPRLQGRGDANGPKLRLLTGAIASPTLLAQIQEFLEMFPQARWHQFEPVSDENVQAGTELAFGRPLNVVYDFSQADAVLSLDSDFLAVGPGHLRHTRDFMARRQLVGGDAAEHQMSRLYAVQTTPTLTGAKADHVVTTTPDEVQAIAAAIASRLGIATEDAPTPSSVTEEWLDAAANDLQNYRLKVRPGASLVVAGPWQPKQVHALVHAINERLGNVGKSVYYTERPELDDLSPASLADLVDDLENENVDALFILGGNPVFTAPADLNFAAALEKAPYRVHLGMYEDETSARCHWHIPQTHYLETWGDGRAYDGTVSFAQPLIAPLYSSKSAHELLAALLDNPRQSYDIVRDFWAEARERLVEETEDTAELDFDDWWQTCLHDGVVAGTQLPPVDVSASQEFTFSYQGQPGGDGQTLISFRPDPTIWDGEFANNGWLQELPKPFSKVVWDNAAYVGPTMAEELGVENNDLIEIAHEDRSLVIPIWIMPGHPEHCVTLHFGYGRARGGRVAEGSGKNVYDLRTSDAPWFAHGATVRKVDGAATLVTTQQHYLMEDRDLIRWGTLDQLHEHPEHPEFAQTEHHGPAASLYPEFEYNGAKWGMTIDLGACIGCNACTIACQAENNIPIVGKAEVMRGREMHWIRVDTYFEGEPESPAAHFQPVPCMHCEKAPCEPVCPVAATTHSGEGLNEMTYNRCVGTRYCANNCPYKVRRFNFFDYNEPVREHATLQMLQNPDVTVRARGVMEKCTYCVQRINQARITAEKSEDRRINDGDLLTACQQACPAQAIMFGDMNDPHSKIAAAKASPLNYGLLEDLNTQPRTTYLAALRNPHPDLESDERHGPAH